MSPQHDPLRAGFTLALLCSLFTGGTRSASAAVPDSTQLARMRQGLERASAVRLTTPFGVSVERKVEVEPDGLKLTGSGDVGAVSIIPEPVSRVGWDHMRKLEVKRGVGKRLLVPFAALGALLGGLYGYSGLDVPTLGGNAGEPLYLLVGASVGLGLGSVIGPAYDPWVRIDTPAAGGSAAD